MKVQLSSDLSSLIANIEFTLVSVLKSTLPLILIIRLTMLFLKERKATCKICNANIPFILALKKYDPSLVAKVVAELKKSNP